MQPNYFPIGVFILAATIFWAIGQPEWWPARATGEIMRAPSTSIRSDSSAIVDTPLPASVLGFLSAE